MSETMKVSLDVLVAMFEEWKNGHGKNMIIIRSVSAIISMISSTLLIWVIFQSKDRLTTAYHRLLIGLSISDLLYSFSCGLFAATSPSELSYIVWNASGSQVSCEAMGFFIFTGAVSGIIYLCSLNLYFLAKVKYNRTENYIRARIEPFLHGVPIAIALAFSTIFLVGYHYNDDGGGTCNIPVYDPPHCIGYEDGEVPSGFTIPCGRGRGGTTFFYAVVMVSIFIPPIIMAISLGSIYIFVSKQERNSARYSIATIRRTSADSNQDNSLGRAVAHKALAYSLTYVLTWIWYIIGAILRMAGARKINPLEMSNWQLAYLYLWNIFSPLQGLFTFLIYMYPNVMKARRSENSNISLCRAFFVAFRSSMTGGNR